MMRSGTRVLAIAFLVGCGGSTDSGLDASSDATLESGGGDASTDSGKDGTATDSGVDGNVLDAGSDASSDGGGLDASDAASDAGDAGLCGVCPPNTACCTIPNAAFYGKCYSQACLACCQ